MTCLETLAPPPLAESCIAVLETMRLVLRAPRLVDAKAVAALANDRRIADNTARIPHPYKISYAVFCLKKKKKEIIQTRRRLDHRRTSIRRQPTARLARH